MYLIADLANKSDGQFIILLKKMFLNVKFFYYKVDLTNVKKTPAYTNLLSVGIIDLWNRLFMRVSYMLNNLSTIKIF